ncbi:MAG: endo-1,4-beta-xylanase [Anaerolineales bacterium]
MKRIAYPLFTACALIVSCTTSHTTTEAPKADTPAPAAETQVSKSETEPTPTETSAPAVQTDIPALKDVFKDKFLIGTAIEPAQLDSPLHVELLKYHFNSITAENAMKPEEIHPSEDFYTFENADRIAEFAQENGIALRGHTLIWHNQIGNWFFMEGDDPVSPETLKARMESHITTIMQHYQGQIYAWDVVNEPVDQNQPDGFYRNKWYEVLGPEYIELAFRYARNADPDAKLFLNEVSTTDPSKRDQIVALVRDLQAKGVPIDGIGMQMHISLTNPSLRDFEAALEAYSQLGIEIQITELDITVYDNRQQSFDEASAELLNEQGHRVKDLFDIMDKYSDSITSVTFWGMTDDQSWLNYFFVERQDWPLPFDANLQAKPFYWGMVDPTKLTPRIHYANASEGTIVVDGVDDERWQFTDAITIADEGSAISAKAKALWDTNYLYLLLQVTDATPLQDDRITLLLDEGNDKTESMDENDSVYHYDLNEDWQNSDDAAVVETEQGYWLEVRLPLEYVEGAVDTMMGFDLIIQDGEGSFIRWNDLGELERTTPAFWGTLTFVESPKGRVVHRGSAILDGVKDEAYEVGDPLIVDTFIQGIEDEENVFTGATAKVWLLWDENALYAYAEVADSVLSAASNTVYLQDSIEIFLDENNRKTGFYEPDDGLYRVSFENTTSFGSTGSVEGFESATKIIDGGYAVEVVLPYRTITPGPGTVIGFDFQVNDDQGSGVRDSISKWNDPSNDSWQSTSGYGVLILQE